jgi:lipopolysaccharide export LptBFGC system permease protein LptF
MEQLFEIIMLLAFGAAWPFSIRTSLQTRSTKGKSIVFLWVVFFGYVSGIVNKFVNDQAADMVVWFYLANVFMVAFDTVLYYRNLRFENARAAE